MDKGKYYQIGSILKLFRMVEVLVSRSEFELAELSRLSKLPKTTVHRMLLTLQDLGYVKQNRQTRSYKASIKFFELGQKVAQHVNLIGVSQPIMSTLSKKVKETVNLGILDGIDGVCIHKLDTENPLRFDQPIGSRYPAYLSSYGKAILAFLPKEKREKLLSGHKMLRPTERSLKTKEDLEKDLNKTRERGYSIDNQESLKGIRCIGAPVFDNNREVIAGISIAAPSVRIPKSKVAELAKEVMGAASAISWNLAS